MGRRPGVVQLSEFIGIECRVGLGFCQQLIVSMLSLTFAQSTKKEGNEITLPRLWRVLVQIFG
jgi:hypothetical protein